MTSQRRTVVRRALAVAGVLGLVTALAGGIVAWRIIEQLDRSVQASLELTDEALTTLDAAVEVAEEALVVVDAGLASTESTVREVSTALDEGRTLLEATAEITTDEVAPAIEAVSATLPGLIDVAGVIDQTLAALAALPIGPDYDPDQSFASTLRDLDAQLADVPDDLAEIGELVAATADSLTAIQEGSAEVADDLGRLRTALGDSAEVLAGYRETTGAARDLVTTQTADLGRDLTVARVLIVLGALSVALGQLVPLGAAWLLAEPRRIRDLLAD